MRLQDQGAGKHLRMFDEITAAVGEPDVTAESSEEMPEILAALRYCVRSRRQFC